MTELEKQDILNKVKTLTESGRLKWEHSMYSPGYYAVLDSWRFSIFEYKLRITHGDFLFVSLFIDAELEEIISTICDRHELNRIKDSFKKFMELPE